jgi:hypothetical protein
MRSTTTIRIASTALVGILFLACEDETSPVDVQPPQPTIDNIWPHEDHRSWTYTIAQYQDSTTADWPNCSGGFCFATPEEVPPAPSLDDIAALIGSQPLPEESILVSGAFRLEFDSLLTTATGFTGQHLTETLYEEAPGPQSVDAGVELRFLSVLAAARPDLRPRIQALAPGIETLSSQVSIDKPLFLFGYSWVKTATEIGSYSEVDTLLGWKYLESNLTVGHEFVWQLVRPLADDVFLHARVIAKGTRVTPIGAFSNAIDVLYMVDFGIGQSIVGSGEYYRVVSYGTITYAPEVGPVAGWERNLVLVGTSGLDRGFSDTTLDLIGTGLPAPPAVGFDDARMR